ncbi:MAG: hypothetical protein RL275_3353 [Chloroflexota bacterium]
MTEQKPESKFITVAKMVGVCIVCFGLIYGIVTLMTALTS